MSIRVFHFHNPHDFRFARAGRVGTWAPSPSPGICPECTASRQKRVWPLIIEWLPDSDLVGDFTWPGLDDEVVVSQRVRESFEDRFCDVTYRPIQMVQDPKVQRPRIVTRRTKPRVWLPYEGPPLWELWPESEAHLDLEASGWSIKKICGTCGTVFYDTTSFERRHLVVDPKTWSGGDIFRIHESGLRFCTERAKTFVEESGFTNVSFLEDGIIPT